jgi:flagellar hook-associated protein 2
LLNRGEGLAKGKIRITDRSGVSAEIDLRYAQTVDDVLNAINNVDDQRAQVSGDAIQLVDQTGQATSN